MRRLQIYSINNLYQHIPVNQTESTWTTDVDANADDRQFYGDISVAKQRDIANSIHLLLLLNSIRGIFAKTCDLPTR